MCPGSGSCRHSLLVGLLWCATVSSCRAFVPPSRSGHVPVPRAAAPWRCVRQLSPATPRQLLFQDAGTGGGCGSRVPAAKLGQADPGRAPLHPLLEPPAAPPSPPGCGTGCAGAGRAFPAGSRDVGDAGVCCGCRMCTPAPCSWLQRSLLRCRNFFPYPEAPSLIAVLLGTAALAPWHSHAGTPAHPWLPAPRAAAPQVTVPAVLASSQPGGSSSPGTHRSHAARALPAPLQQAALPTARSAGSSATEPRRSAGAAGRAAGRGIIA